MNDYTGRPLVLPTTREALAKLRKVKTNRTLNDHVEDIVAALIEDADFRRLIDATDDSDALEGSMSIDTVLAVQMIRDKAKESKSIVGEKKLETIKHALGVVLRRYNLDRKTLRNMVHGEIVPPPSQDNNGD